MRDINELNIEDDYFVPSMDEIRALERWIGKKLPESYIKFILAKNGGCPELNTFYYQGEDYVVNHFFFVGRDNDSTESIYWIYENSEEAKAHDLLPIAQDGCGNYYCFDLSKSDQAPVLFVPQDIIDYEPQKLANNFDEFINGLSESPD